MSELGPEREAEYRTRILALEKTVRELREQHEWKDTLLRTIPARVILASIDGEIEYVNHVDPAYEGPDPKGQKLFRLIAPKYAPQASEAIDRAIAHREVANFEVVTPGPGTGEVDYLFVVGPVFRRGEVSGIVLVGTDITKVRQAEASLSDYRAQLHLALNAAALGTWRWDRGNDKVVWDERMLEMFGVSREQEPKTAADFLALVPDDQRDFVSVQLANALETGQYPDFELRIDRHDGPRWLSIRGGATFSEEKQVTGLMGAVIDITQQRKMEETLRHQHKMVATGQLSAGVAHNFNNMLAVILPALELARQQCDPQIAQLLDDAVDSASNAAQLVRDMMTFSKNAPPGKIRRESLAGVVRRAVELCQRTFERRVAIVIESLSAANHCAVDSAAMEQALMNLLINARDALEESHQDEPRILVTASSMDEEQGRRLYPHGPGACIELCIVDNGSGMDDETRRRIMEPFFTTKQASRGTGLGLSTAWATIEAHGGLLECESMPNEGTSFSIVLPRGTDETLTPMPRTSSSQLKPASGAIVLVIDDEAGVRRATAYILESAGYIVRHASTGSEGLEVAASEKVQLILMDYSMPGLAPEIVLKKLREQHPQVPVVSMSGLGTTLDGADAYLTKPVERDALLQALSSLLSARRIKA